MLSFRSRGCKGSRRNALQPEDWTDIGVKLGNRDDPLYQPGFEEKFKTLRRGILAMEAEAEAERVASLRNEDILEQRRA